MTSAIPICKKPETKAALDGNSKVKVVKISTSNYALFKADGTIFNPLEILNLFKEDSKEAEKLKGPSYWLEGTLNGISGHCTIGENGDIAKISGKEWIDLPPNKKIYVVPGGKPPYLTVEAASGGNITYIMVDFTVEPSESVRNAIYKPNEAGNPSDQLLRTEEAK
jgi:hypothetical protein